MRPEDRYDSLIQYYGGEKGIGWLLLKAQIKAESNFDPNAKSWVGALGLPQFMKATWEEWKDGTPGIQATKMILNRTNPEHAIRAQAAYMKWLLDRLDNDVDHALAAYNWGIGRVKAMLRKHGHLVEAEMPEETVNYVKRIRKFHKEYCYL